MRAWKVLDVKIFMNHMLRLETFDGFLLSEASVTMRMHVDIDGHIPADAVSAGETAEAEGTGERCVFYREVRPVCFDIIKGKRTPEKFRFVFLLSQRQTAEFLENFRLNIPQEDIANISLNVSFQNGELLLTTGTARRTFTMDRSLDVCWEQWVEAFMKDNSVAMEKIS